MPTMMSAKEVFIALIESMEADNGCEFDTTAAQQRLGEELITYMMVRGWNPELVTEGLDPTAGYRNDIEAFTQGEHTDVQKIAQAWGGGELDELLTFIFNHG